MDTGLAVSDDAFVMHLIDLSQLKGLQIGFLEVSSYSLTQHIGKGKLCSWSVHWPRTYRRTWRLMTICHSNYSVLGWKTANCKLISAGVSPMDNFKIKLNLWEEEQCRRSYSPVPVIQPLQPEHVHCYSCVISAVSAGRVLPVMPHGWVRMPGVLTMQPG